ncbi:glycerol-3-phosphate 1-O-acyltransferase PlsY [Acidiphilium sp.]|uniref:glycerol-3-phosphate 1-O-acyltransferase PlsY n=1 Tax=Acidiphilium sp. TaxID=527 RepID=UPI002583B67E|nr:glycerol-3-phosphate 1-O-acyltransferase PlsY [Acidiphilium sp.]
MAGACFLLGYFLGAIPFGLLLTRLAGLGDIRAIGSGNIGATNVLRTGRRGLAAATLLLDAAKGVAAVLLVRFWLAPGLPALLWLAALGAVIGHVFPLWLGFRGGKGVATALGVLLAACWPVGVLVCVIWLLAAVIGRRSSLAALIAFAASPLLAFGFAGADALAPTLAIAALIFWRHTANIARLLAGTEPRIGTKS